MQDTTLTPTIDFGQGNLLDPAAIVNNFNNLAAEIFDAGLEFIDQAFNPEVLDPALTLPSVELPLSISAQDFSFPDINTNLFDPATYDPLINFEIDGFLPELPEEAFTLDPTSFDTLDFEPASRNSGVIGTDDRVQVTRPDPRIGRLVLPNGSFGTATLVGRFTAITNAHVVEGWDGRSPLRFVAGETSQGSYGSFSVNRTLSWTDHPSTPWNDDFAIITFSQPVGDRFGWLGYTTRATTTPNFQDTATLTGYSGDRFRQFGTPSRDIDLVRGDVAGRINDWTHTIDMNFGSSGSALVSSRDQRVLGVNWGFYTDLSLNGWTPLNRNFFDWIQRADREAAQAYNR